MERTNHKRKSNKVNYIPNDFSSSNDPMESHRAGEDIHHTYISWKTHTQHKRNPTKCHAWKYVQILWHSSFQKKKTEPNSPPLEGKLGHSDSLLTKRTRQNSMPCDFWGHKNGSFHLVLFPSNHSRGAGGVGGVGHHVLRTGPTGFLTPAHMKRNRGLPPTARTNLPGMWMSHLGMELPTAVKPSDWGPRHCPSSCPTETETIKVFLLGGV